MFSALKPEESPESHGQGDRGFVICSLKKPKKNNQKPENSNERLRNVTNNRLALEYEKRVLKKEARNLGCLGTHKGKKNLSHKETVRRPK